ncbi:MAG TPA: DUF3592 domain-containing protein [Acidobacteriaceae bacterium]|nr:DUF3592 domain-containing protein [Acidobacteriaceae bacterium]
MEFLRWVRKSFEQVAPLLAGALPVLGLGLLVMAAGFAAHSWNFARTRVRTTATITENVSGFAKEGGVVYAPRFRFRLPSGELVTVQAAKGSEEIEFAAGEVVPVLYRADDPQEAVIATVWRAYEGAIVLGVLGVVLFDVGWALRVMLRARAAVAD